MSSRPAEFLALYTEHRVRDQLTWYGQREAEFTSGRRQVGVAAGVVMVLASVAAYLAGTGVGPGRAVWTALGAALPAVSAMLVAYERLYAFDRLSTLYADTAASLDRVGPPPEIGRMPEGEAARAIRTYVAKVERVARKEQGQWGQLTAELDLDAPT